MILDDKAREESLTDKEREYMETPPYFIRNKEKDSLDPAPDCQGGGHGIYSQVKHYHGVLITPDMATEFLNTMGINRGKHKYEIGRLTNDIKNGDFKGCPNPICFSKNGRLLDGQHRLESIVKAGVPTAFNIEVGWPEDTVFDRGTSRTTKDEFKCRNMVAPRFQTKRAVSIINSFLSAKLGQDRALNLSDDQKARFVKKYEDEFDAVEDISKAGANPYECYRGSVQAGILAALICGVPRAKLEDFCEVVNTGIAHSDRETAGSVLWKYLSLPKKYSRATKDEMCAFTEMAIRDFIVGKPRKAIYKNKEHVFVDQVDIEL